ncbi:MAG: hypothetical protein K0R24_1687 [Gammaproteobacteria bacterium]|jgi:hypothetical protein|nr:hypothetical protein [Gammaproteobacteria bacterium]
MLQGQCQNTIQVLPTSEGLKKKGRSEEGRGVNRVSNVISHGVKKREKGTVWKKPRAGNPL